MQIRLFAQQLPPIFIKWAGVCVGATFITHITAIMLSVVLVMSFTAEAVSERKSVIYSQNSVDMEFKKNFLMSCDNVDSHLSHNYI